MDPIVTVCPTCQRRLMISDPSLAGQIVLCPSCQSMVEVPVPPGGMPPTTEPRSPMRSGPSSGFGARPPATAQVADSQLTEPSLLLPGGTEAGPPSVVARSVRGGTSSDSSTSQTTQPIPIPTPPPTPLNRGFGRETDASVGAEAGRRRGFRMEGVPPEPILPENAAAKSDPEPSLTLAEGVLRTGEPTDPVSHLPPAATLWWRGILLGGVSLLGVVLAVIVCVVIATQRSTGSVVADAADAQADRGQTNGDGNDNDPTDQANENDPPTDVAIPPAMTGDDSVGGIDSTNLDGAIPPTTPDESNVPDGSVPTDLPPPTPPTEDAPPVPTETPVAPANAGTTGVAPSGADTSGGGSTETVVESTKDVTAARTGNALTAAMSEFGPLFGGPFGIDVPTTPTTPDATASDPAATEAMPDGVPVAADPDAPPTEDLTPPGAWPIDLERAMKEPIAGLRLPETSVVGFLRLVESLAHVPITLEPETAFHLLHAGPNQVNVSVGETTVAELLQTGLGPLDLGVIQTGRGLIVSADAPGLPVKDVRLPIDDLIRRDGAASERFVAMVKQFVRPGTWNGAKSASKDSPPEVDATDVVPLRIDGNELVVVRSSRVNLEVAAFLDRVRQGRGLPVRGAWATALTTPVRAGAAESDTLSKPVFANFVRPTPLMDMLNRYATESGAAFLIDGVSLSAAGYAPDAELTAVVESESLRLALDRLLRRRGLSWRVIGQDVIEITTPAGAVTPFSQFIPTERTLSPEAAAIRIESARAALTPHLGKLAAEPSVSEPPLVYDPPAEGRATGGGFWVRLDGKALSDVMNILRPAIPEPESASLGVTPSEALSAEPGVRIYAAGN